jgi:ankyrin repeat protein
MAKLALVVAMGLPLFCEPGFPDWMTGRPGPDERLLAAISTDDLPAFDQALADGASPAFRSESDTVPLTDAAARGRLEMTRRLVAVGADMNACEGRGMTALMLAASRDHVEIVELLVRRGADLSCRDRSHRTALDIAIDYDCTGAAKALRRASTASNVE